MVPGGAQFICARLVHAARYLRPFAIAGPILFALLSSRLGHPLEMARDTRYCGSPIRERSGHADRIPQMNEAAARRMREAIHGATF